MTSDSKEVEQNGESKGIIPSTRSTHMNAIRQKPALRTTVATVLFIFGVASLALPVLPGWVFLGMSLYLFSIDSPRIQGHVHRYRTRFSSLDKVLKHSYDKFHNSYEKLQETAKKELDKMH